MAVRLVIDTCSDLVPADLDPSVVILPIPVFIGGKEYIPFKDLSPEEFYHLQETSPSLPTTSQTPLKLLFETFKSLVKNGDEVVAVFMGSAHSGTYNSACVARQQVGDEFGREAMERIYIVDSQNVTFPEAALDLEAFKMIKAGKGARETAKRVEYLVPRIHMRAFIQDLRYLKIGGRISGVKASIAEFLNFKVVIKTGCNLIEPTDKLRGLPRALRCITDTANSEDIDYSLPSYIGHTNDPELAERLLVETKEETKLNPAKIFSIGPTVGAHVGRGCTGLCWFIK